MGTDGGSALNRNVQRYGIALLAAFLALVARKVLSPALGEQNPYHVAWPMVVFTAWYCGMGPTVLAVVVELAGIWYWFLLPFHSIQLQDPRPDVAGMLWFTIFSACIIALGEANRRSLARSKSAEEEVRNAHAELELKVQQRTAELSTANESLQELSGRLQQLRDDERRRIARELHDSVGQMLAALSMNIATIQTQSGKLDGAAARAVSENAAIVEQISKEIRTISHLLHPPLIDIAGLASAIRWYVDGFSERSKIEVEMDIPEDFRRLSGEMEIGIFRMVQECLTNIHRHSGSNTAKIIISQEDDHIVVQIKDNGKGIPAAKQLELSSSGRVGVGFRGMRERLRQFGGEINIQSNGPGTLITAVIPLSASAEPALVTEKVS